MFSFLELTTGNFLDPHIEFETNLKLDFSSLLNSNLFVTVSHKFGVDLYIPSGSTTNRTDQKLKIFRFTPDFRFRINLEIARSIPPEKTILYSASNQYFNHLNQLLALEPSFKLKPAKKMESYTLKEMLLDSSFKTGYIEIASWTIDNTPSDFGNDNNVSIEEIYITSLEEFEPIDFTNIHRVDRYALYDIEKNRELAQLQSSKKLDSNSSQLDLFNLEDTTGYSLSTQHENQSHDKPHKKEEDILRDMLFNYFSENVSESAAKDVLKNTSGKSIPDILRYVNSYVRNIKFNQNEHREKIKAIVADFYTEHFHYLSNQNITQAIEEFYTNN